MLINSNYQNKNNINFGSLRFPKSYDLLGVIPSEARAIIEKAPTRVSRKSRPETINLHKLHTRIKDEADVFISGEFVDRQVLEELKCSQEDVPACVRIFIKPVINHGKKIGDVGRNSRDIITGWIDISPFKKAQDLANAITQKIVDLRKSHSNAFHHAVTR